MFKNKLTLTVGSRITEHEAPGSIPGSGGAWFVPVCETVMESLRKQIENISLICWFPYDVTNPTRELNPKSHTE